MEGRNSLNRFGATPFFLAAKSVDVPLMEVLLELGADPFIGNVDGDSPLMVAAGVGVYSQGESPGLARGIGRCGEDAARPRRRR